MKLAKDQLASIYHIEREHLTKMFKENKLTRQEYDKELAELSSWVEETFNNENKPMTDKMLLLSKDFIIACANVVEELYEEFHYAQDYYCADELQFVSAIEFLSLLKVDKLTSH